MCDFCVLLPDDTENGLNEWNNGTLQNGKTQL